MLRRLSYDFRHKWPIINKSFILQKRYLKDRSHPIMGGGLEKPQGGLKEEKYFCNQNSNLMTELCQEGTKLKCENCLNDWKEFEKVLNTNDIPTSLRETCSLNIHKNCLEEAFFLNEQTECCTKLMKEHKKNINETGIENKSQNVFKKKIILSLKKI